MTKPCKLNEEDLPSYEYKKKDPVYGLAILKVSMELKGGDLGIYDGIVAESCEKLGIKEKDVDRYIRKNRSQLEEDCRKQGLV